VQFVLTMLTRIPVLNMGFVTIRSGNCTLTNYQDLRLYLSMIHGKPRFSALIIHHWMKGKKLTEKELFVTLIPSEIHFTNTSQPKAADQRG
jgi:hypothetical protein